MPQPNRSRVVALALCAVFLTGADGGTYAAGKALVEAGSYVEAAQHWAEALVANPGDKGARKGLKKYGEMAWRQALDRARELEADGDYAQAIVAFEAVMALERVYDSYDLARFEMDPDETRAERDDAERRLLEGSYAKGLAAAQIGQWPTALEQFEIARTIDPIYQDLPEELGKVHRALAEEALAGARYEESVSEYQAAFEFTRDDAHLAWASAILAAMGRYYLREGGCRQAVEAFERALPYAVNEPRLDQDLAAAHACAELDLLVPRFEMAPGLTVPAGYDLGALAADKLSEQLSSQGSRYVRILDPARPPTEASLGRRYEVRGRVARLEVVRPAARSSREQGTGVVRDLCPGEGAYYTSKEEYCDEDVTVSWEQWDMRVEMKISASIKVIDPLSSLQLLTRTHDASAEHAARQVRDFQRLDGEAWSATAVGDVPSRDVVALPPELLALQAEPAPLPTDADMVSHAAENLAVQAAKEVLAEVDTDRAVAPPRLLANIRRPVMSAEDIELAPGGEVITQPLGPVPKPAPIEIPVPVAPPTP